MSRAKLAVVVVLALADGSHSWLAGSMFGAAAIYAPHVLAGTVSFETEAPDARAMVAQTGSDLNEYFAWNRYY